jgi:hypothetical protein
MVSPDAFRPLLPAARDELARQINAVAPDAQALVAVGFGWGLAIQITRQMLAGGNPSILCAAGLSAPLANAIATAVDEAIAARTPVVAPESRPVRTARGTHMLGGLKREWSDAFS